MVEAAGQLFHPFRDGLDYAFILHRLAAMSRMRGVLSAALAADPGAGPALARFGQSMSLYRAGRVGLVPPLGVAMSLPSATKGSPNEPRYHFTLSSEGNRSRSFALN